MQRMGLRADGKVFPTALIAGEVSIPDQRAMVFWSKGEERLVIETRFDGRGTDFAWVVPLPAVPRIEPESLLAHEPTLDLAGLRRGLGELVANGYTNLANTSFPQVTTFTNPFTGTPLNGTGQSEAQVLVAKIRQNEILSPQPMSANRKPPVDWNRLKQIQDENQQPRMPGGAVLAVLLLGLSAIAFFCAFYAALDPMERIEPAKHFFFVAVAFGLFAGWAGVLCLLGAPPRGNAE